MGKGKTMPVGRPVGYVVHGQGRGAKYPEVTLPGGSGYEVGKLVEYRLVVLAGEVMLSEGDLVLSKLDGTR